MNPKRKEMVITLVKELTRALAILVIAILAFGYFFSSKEDFIKPKQKPSIFSVGGTVTGLNGEMLVLENRGIKPIRIAQSGAFAFTIRDGTHYDVKVAEQPKGHSCYVENGFGSIYGKNVHNIKVICN